VVAEFEGPCIGGPLDGRRMQSRHPYGALAVDKAAGRAWVYDWGPVTRTFKVRHEEGAPLDTPGRYRAAAEPDYDVWAL
jgi:hypothetical protein